MNKRKDETKTNRLMKTKQKTNMNYRIWIKNNVF